MKQKTKTVSALSLHLRMRITGPETIALGPGKVELLAFLDETGSITEAARRMKMSYMKAWSLIQTMKPLVHSSRGGGTGGGAQLTASGHEALALYRKMESDSLRACQDSWEKMQLLLKT